ncbi:death domain-containing protein CRADD-like [Physella acuta]|uniref:death domain-containing protein CRADD-like n=1 Tax=Physella acuta TaxID=109671 RepID=UPI0027DB28BA|nr:death domain-containing protein CRADD-like [Physella acuta]
MSGGNRGKLKSEDEERIKKNYQLLKDEIDPKYIVDHMFSQSVFNLDDKEEILCHPSRGGRAEAFLNKLLNAGPNKAYAIFVNVLEEEYPHVAEKLKSTVLDIKLEECPYSWFDDSSDIDKNHRITQAEASRLASCFGKNWEHVMLQFGHRMASIEIELQSKGNNIRLTITNLLIRWCQQQGNNATYRNFIDTLKKASETQVATIDWEGIQEIMLLPS